MQALLLLKEKKKGQNGISKSGFREVHLEDDFVKEGPKVIYPC